MKKKEALKIVKKYGIEKIFDQLMNKIDKKQLHDSKVFEKAIKIIMSKSKNPKKTFFLVVQEDIFK